MKERIDELKRLFNLCSDEILMKVYKDPIKLTFLTEIEYCRNEHFQQMLKLELLERELIVND